MAHQGLFPPEQSSDASTGQSPWSRSEDLQGIMGSPLIPIDPFLDSPNKPGTVSSNFSPSLYFSPNLASRRPTMASRSFLPSPPAWPDHQGGARPSFYLKPRPEQPSNLRVNAEQDAWSSLRITGPPPLRPKNQIHLPVTPISDKTSPVSTGPSHDSFQSSASDSGYGTRSVGSSKSATSLVLMDFGGRIRHLPPHVYSKPTAAPSFSHLPPLLPVETEIRQHDPRRGYPNVSGPGDHPDQQTCDIPGCGWAGRCPSDKRKHILRHERPFLCKESGCKRKRGFGTLNDLERHKLCVHGVESERGSAKLFKCFAENCPRGQQIWPRYDNFKQHLRRMHGDPSVKELIRKSEQWYESTKHQQDIVGTTQKPLRDEERPQRNNAHLNDGNSLGDGASYISAPGVSEAAVETVQPATLYKDSSSAAFSGSSALDLSRLHTFGSIDGGSQISVDVAASVISTEDQPQTEQGNARYGWNNANPNKQQLARDRRPSGEETRLESALFRDIHLDRLELPSVESVKESAMGLFKALEKETNNAVLSKDRSGEGASRGLDPGNVPSFVDILRASGDEERLILRELLRAGLERLGEQQSTGSSKQRSKQGSSDSGSSQCLFDRPFVCSHEGCNKRTRRQCEMRKHEMRHQRPYGCTFTNCTKKFGSKNDWKRHEITRHFHHQSWRCREEVRQKNSLEKTECGENFSRRNTFVDHLRKVHNLGQNDVSECLKRDQIGPNSQVRFWCGFCRCSCDVKSQGLKAIDERFDHIDGHIKGGADMTSWTPPTNENILKDKSSGNIRTSRQTSRFDGDESTLQEDDNERAKILQPAFSQYPVPVHVTQNTSYERGRRPAKQHRTALSRDASPSGRRHSQVSFASSGSQRQNSTAAPGPSMHEKTIWEPGKHTNKEIAESLIYICETPQARDVVSVTCCRCENIPGNILPPRYDLAIQYCCAVCRHKPCQQCTRHHEVQPTSEELRDADKPVLPGALT